MKVYDKVYDIKIYGKVYDIKVHDHDKVYVYIYIYINDKITPSVTDSQSKKQCLY
jgi:hypothetical protein